MLIYKNDAWLWPEFKSPRPYPDILNKPCEFPFNYITFKFVMYFETPGRKGRSETLQIEVKIAHWSKPPLSDSYSISLSHKLIDKNQVFVWRLFYL